MMMTTRSLTFRIPHSAFRIRRKGMSMAEVLVALFLLALGTIAILTMFPLGMYHMGQALKDDRTAQAANQADAFMRMYWRTNVIENANARNAAATGYPGYEPLVPAFDFPDSKPDLFGSGTPIALGNVPVGRLPSVQGIPGPSYPVFVDPMGWLAPWSTLNPSSYSFQYWVAGTGFYPRRSMNLLLNSPATMSQRVCTLLDGYGYDEGGVPLSVTGVAGGTFERDLRYNWMWILQRPDNTDPNTATMTVVVFDKRAFQFAAAGAEQVFASGPQPAQQIPMVPGTTVIQIPKTQGTPPVQKGGWIMDATPGLRHAIFYRVVSVTDNPNNVWNLPGPTVVPTTDLEIQVPVRRLDGSTGSYGGTLVFFTGVSEVFERPNLRAADY
ncbi:MAG: hypothetical protein U0791_20765 [Gemmataceae bacterium]